MYVLSLTCFGGITLVLFVCANFADKLSLLLYVEARVEVTDINPNNTDNVV